MSVNAINLSSFPVDMYFSLEDVDLSQLGNGTYNYVTMAKTNGKNKIVVVQNGAYLILGSGRTVQIDEEDIDAIQLHRWWTAGKGYVGTEIDGEKVYLHRYLMNPEDDMVVDHINRNGYYNRRQNLKVKTAKENSWNRTASSNTGYVGITITDKKRRKKYNAYLYFNYDLVLNKNFQYLVDARIARLEAELKYRGEHVPGMLKELQYLIDHREEIVDTEKLEKWEVQEQLIFI